MLSLSMIMNKPKWWARAVGVRLYGVVGIQTDDMKGVRMPSGRFVAYGSQQYRFLWFAGRIISP